MKALFEYYLALGKAAILSEHQPVGRFFAEQLQ